MLNGFGAADVVVLLGVVALPVLAFVSGARRAAGLFAAELPGIVSRAQTAAVVAHPEDVSEKRWTLYRVVDGRLERASETDLAEEVRAWPGPKYDRAFGSFR